MDNAQKQPADAVGSSEGLGLYPERDHAAQGDHYLRHIDAMTREGLHAKSRIAGELAARDIEIERLRALAEHLRHCRECGETDVANCVEGEPLWDACMPKPAAEIGGA